MNADDDFLDLLYRAPAHPDRWIPAMERLADMVGGGTVWLSVLNVVDGGGQGLWARIDPAFTDRFFSYYAARNPLNLVRNPIRFMAEWRPRILTDEDWMPKSDLCRTEYYNDFLKPVEATSCVMIRLARHPETTSASVINIARGSAKGAFDRHELETLDALHPHLIRALKLSETIARARLDGVVGATTSPGVGVMLLDDDGRVLSANPAAEAILRRRDALDVRGNRLLALDPVAEPKLAALISSACAPPPAPRVGGHQALLRLDRATPYIVSVAPYDDHGAEAFLRERYALVIVNDLEEAAKPPADVLRNVFGFTRAETRLALALLDGSTVKQAANRLDVSPNTAHVHLARIFGKTGVNRQASLMALLSRVAAKPDVF